MIERLSLVRVPSPFSTAPQSGADRTDFWLADAFKPADPKFAPHVEAATLGRVIGCRTHARCGPDEIEIALPGDARRFVVLLTMAVEEQTRSDLVGAASPPRFTRPGRGGDAAPTTASALAAARRTLSESQARGVPELRRQHEQHWHSFWGKSQIELADRFLEKLWFVNLYALACCDGTGTRWKSQATGLNGLWDIKQPDGWGSCWYWDVNIQEAYWGCYTANHLEMTQPFYDGLREYVPAARRRARDSYQMRGIAPDFPHPFYHCIWPWCCQFLWWGYRYSMDERFLRDVAYPIMREVLEFFDTSASSRRERRRNSATHSRIPIGRRRRSTWRTPAC